MASNPTSHSLPAKPSTTTSASLSFMAQPQHQPSPSPPANDTTHHHHLLYQQRLADHALLPPLDIHNTRFSSSKLAHSTTGTTHLNSPSAAAFGALGFGHPMMMDGGLGLLQSTTNDLDPAGTLSEMFQGQLSLAGVGGIGLRAGDGALHRETNVKSISDGGWICSSTRCLAHNLPNNSHCYICRSPRPHDMPLTTTSSNPSTPPRSASSSSSTFSFPPSPSSTASFGSGPAAFMYPKQQQQQNNSPVGAPLRLQGTSGALSGGTSLGLMMGGKTLYSTPPPPSLHLPPLQNPNGTVGQLGGGGIGPTTPQVLPLPALPPHLLPARLGGTGNGVTPQPQPQSQPFLLQNTTTPQLTNNPLLNLTALTNILAPSGLRLSQGGRVRNVCPDALNPILMFWPDNEPLPVLGQCRPPLPPDFSKNGSGARDGESARGAAAAAGVGGVGDANEVRKANGLPPILNTGNVGPMEKQPLDWTCGVCKYINWRRRKVCQCCFPYAPGNEPPANHEDKLKIISALLTSSGASASGAPSASLPAGMFNSATSSAFNVTPAPHSFAPTMNANATAPPSLAAQHQLFQQLQRDQHQLLQMQLQLQIQKAQAQLTLFTQQQQQQLQQRQGFGGGGVGTLGVAGNGGMVGWNNNSVPSSASASSSEMGSSRAGSPFVLGNKSAALTNLAPIMNSGLLAKPTTPMSTTSAAAPTQSSPSPLSIFSATSGTKKSIWAMDGGSSTPASSASGSPSSTARSSPTSFNNAIDPEATVKLGSAVWLGSGAVSQNPAGAAAGNRFGEIGSGKAPQLFAGGFGGAGVARKASLPMSQIGATGGAATFGSSSGSPTGLGNASFYSSSSSSSLPSLNGPRTPVSGMAAPGTGSFGIGNGGSALF